MEMSKLQKRCFGAAVLLAVIMIAGVTLISLFADSFVTGEYKLQAGKNLEVSDLVNNPVIELFTRFEQKPDMSQPGEYQVELQVGVQKVRTYVRVVDSRAPVVKLREISVIQGRECDISEFVVSIDDATETSVAYVRQPNFTRAGIQNVRIKVVDAYGNETEEQTQLVVVG